jgi:hypothetical protein
MFKYALTALFGPRPRSLLPSHLRKHLFYIFLHYLAGTRAPRLYTTPSGGDTPKKLLQLAPRVIRSGFNRAGPAHPPFLQNDSALPAKHKCVFNVICTI